MQHFAMKVKNNDELLAMRDRLRAKGVPVMGPLDHGMCCSIYFAGPENLSLELSYSPEPINAEAWCDPEVVELAGISEAELEKFKHPASFEDQGGKVAQPDVSKTAGPHMTNYPEGVYEVIMGIPDEQYLTMMENKPPVSV